MPRLTTKVAGDPRAIPDPLKDETLRAAMAVPRDVVEEAEVAGADVVSVVSARPRYNAIVSTLTARPWRETFRLPLRG